MTVLERPSLAQASIVVATRTNGPITLVEREITFVRDNKKLQLSKKQCNILRRLMDEYPSGLCKRELLEAIGWSREMATQTHTISTHIYRLRKSLEEIDIKDFIEQESGCYRIAW